MLSNYGINNVHKNENIRYVHFFTSTRHYFKVRHILRRQIGDSEKLSTYLRCTYSLLRNQFLSSGLLILSYDCIRKQNPQLDLCFRWIIKYKCF